MHSDEQTGRPFTAGGAARKSIRRALCGTAVAAALPCALLGGTSAAQARPADHFTRTAPQSSRAVSLADTALRASPANHYAGRNNYDLLSGTATWYNRSVHLSGRVTSPRRPSIVGFWAIAGSRGIVDKEFGYVRARTSVPYSFTLNSHVRGGISEVIVGSYNDDGGAITRFQPLKVIGRP